MSTFYRVSDNRYIAVSTNSNRTDSDWLRPQLVEGLAKNNNLTGIAGITALPVLNNRLAKNNMHIHLGRVGYA
jgi:hypothetical protein